MPSSAIMLASPRCLSSVVPLLSKRLLGDAHHHAGADGLAALADGEALLLLHGDGVISSTSMVALSPGMIISVPAGSVHCPVTSVVRK